MSHTELKPVTVPASLVRAAHTCIAKKDVRYYLTGFCLFSSGRIVGTNGHIMFSAKLDDAAIPDKDVVIRLSGKIPPKAEYVRFDFSQGIALAGGKAITFDVIDESFITEAAIDRVIPPRERTAHTDGFGISSVYLATIADAFNGAPVSISHGTEMEAVRVEYRGFHPELMQSVMVIMPLRTPDKFRTLYTESPEEVIADYKKAQAA